MIKKFLGAFMLFIVLLLGLVCSADVIIKPDTNKGHPYVFLNDEFISSLKDENGAVKPAFARSYSSLLTAARKDLPTQQPEGGYISWSISQNIMARALMYALGEFDYNHARETIEFTLEYLKKPLTAKTYSIDMYKDIGEYAIQTGALVYDWCYDALKEDEKVLLHKYVMEQYKDTNGDGSPNYNQPCRADNVSGWTDIAGKSVGQPLMYNAITAAAFYDINPDFYNKMMGRIQGSMADAVKAYGSVGALSDGSIQYGRFLYTYYVCVLFQRMGATEAQLLDLYGDQSAFGYKMIYSRTPWGATMRQGDGYTLANYSINHFTAGTEVNSIGILANLYGNQYFKQHYIKENYAKSSLYKFLTMDCETEAKLPDTLPLAFKTASPRTEIMARTSWKEGINSPAVFAYMNMNERRSGDHDHADIGNFQLHYKGPLTMPSGIYVAVDWGDAHWSNYYTRSIAANCITVYDPDETYKYGNKNYVTIDGVKYPLANDGGQKMAGNKDGGYVIGNYAEHFSDSNLWAETEGIFIGPNKQTPAFSYVKGDITKAYSENKMESYKRSMVFMDTFSDTYPGVMIVFDRVVSKNAAFDKKWLLQAVSKPQIDGNKITITNTKDGANGKLVNTVLLPEKSEITEVGGISKYVVDGVEYPPKTDYAAAEAYKSGYRAEVSPSSENKEDIFLNAMFVTDADTTAPDLEMIKEETAEFVGVTTLDRTVLFSKNGSEISASFEITLRNNNQSDKMLCFIGDLKSGKWKVSGNGTNIILETNNEENCIVFSALPGKYTVTPVNSGTVTELLWEEEPKEKLGDFIIKNNNGYINIVDENILIDGEPYISVDTAKNLGVNIIREGNKLIFKNALSTAEVIVGESSYYLNGGEIEITSPVIEKNGIIYIPALQMQSALGIYAVYAPEALLLNTESHNDISGENLVMPQKVNGVKKAGILCDGIIAEKITFGTNTYPLTYLPTVYEFDGVKNITEILVAGTECLKFYASLDGENYYMVTLLESSRANSVTTYKVDICAKYIKFEATVSGSVSEVAAYGTPYEKCAFASDKIKTVSNKEPLKIQAYIEEGFDSASIYVGDSFVCDITEEDDEVYDISVPESFLNESATIKIEAYYSGVLYTAERDITVINTGEKYQFINENFDGGNYDKVFGNRTGYRFSRNTNGISESIAENKYTIFFDKQVTSSVPYIAAANFKYGKGFYDICFDAEISSPYITITFELRDSDNKNVNNATYPLVYGIEGSYEFIIRADTLNGILRVFAKEKNSGKDFFILKEHKFLNKNLGQIRFNVSSRAESAQFSIDNFYVDFYPVDISVFSPQKDTVYQDKVLLSASAPGADEVYFYVNDKEVCNFTSPKFGLCEYEAVFDTNGIKVFDVYCRKGDNIYTESCTFVFGESAVSDVKWGGASIKTDLGYVLNCAAKSVEILLGRADVNVKSVKLNGTEIEFTASQNNENVITVSDLTLDKTGILEIVLESEATESLPIYVTGGNEISTMPAKVNEKNGEIFTFTKAVNFGENTEIFRLFVSEYDENDSLAQIKCNTKQILPLSTNALAEKLSIIDGAGKYKTFIFDTQLSNVYN